MREDYVGPYKGDNVVALYLFFEKKNIEIKFFKTWDENNFRAKIIKKDVTCFSSYQHDFFLSFTEYNKGTNGRQETWKIFHLYCGV